MDKSNDNVIVATYKCKLCGSCMPFNLAVDSPEYYGDEIRYFAQYPDKAPTLIHRCDDGGQGLFEFVGIK